ERRVAAVVENMAHAGRRSAADDEPASDRPGAPGSPSTRAGTQTRVGTAAGTPVRAEPGTSTRTRKLEARPGRCGYLHQQQEARIPVHAVPPQQAAAIFVPIPLHLRCAVVQLRRERR